MGDLQLQNVEDSTPNESNSFKINVNSSLNEGANVNQNFPGNIKEFLNRISSDVDSSTNVRFKKEHQRLTDLLTSYNRLTERLQKEIVAPANKNNNSLSKTADCKPKEIISKLPEIYAVLRPDLYKDVREEEKRHLITKFAKKRIYTAAEKVLPPHTVPSSYVLQDRRQNEKDRFCRLVSASSTKFHNPIENISSITKPLRTCLSSTIKVENVREKEKDRLAKIFATSTLRDSKRIRVSNRIQQVNTKGNTLNTDGTVQASIDGTLGHHQVISVQDANESDMCKIESAVNQENINPQIGNSINNMVRVGEYSPLNGCYQGKTVLGIGEHEQQRKRLSEERRREYKNLMEKQNSKDQKLRGSQSNKVLMESSKFECLSKRNEASTQTDSEESTTSFQDEQGDFDSPVQSVSCSPRQRRPFDYSPREKLMLDLYGSSPLSNYQAAFVEKEKQIAYRDALREQIEEKKTLEEERKRREVEEEKLIEKRVREQTEKLRLEYLKEQNKKCNWMQQRKEQEEVLRKRLVELELESKELKRQERQKKLQNLKEDEQCQGSPTRRVLQRRLTSQNPVDSQACTIKPGNPNLPVSVQIPPLLYSAKENMLSTKASDLKEAFDDNHDDDTEGTLKLGPGVNLLSPHYHLNDKRSVDDYMSLSRKQSTSSVPFERFVPSVETPRLRGHTADDEGGTSNFSARNQQEICRPPSPVIPSLQTDMILKRSAKMYDDKWKKLPSSSHHDINNIAVVEPLFKDEPVPNMNILTQLGEFRRTLELEHQLLEQRLQQNNS